jgi:hypothetical protein
LVTLSYRSARPPMVSLSVDHHAFTWRSFPARHCVGSTA